LLGYKALSDAGLRPERDLRLTFTGFPADALLYLLREKAVQAVIVPVCLLEKMDEEGLIRKTDFMTVLNHPTSIPCLTSTPLYPDWSFAALPAVSDELADRVTRVLFNAPQNATFRWGAPASTREVEALLRDVRQHPQQRQLWLDVKSWFIQHRLAMGGGHRAAVADAQLHLGDAVGSPTRQAAGAEQRVVAQTGTGAGDCPTNERAGGDDLRFCP
jgi:two-component system sensor histidine kinase TtrS